MTPQLTLASLLVSVALVLGGCQSQGPGPGEKTGRYLDNAAKATGEALGDAVQWTGEKMERAGENLQEAGD